MSNEKKSKKKPKKPVLSFSERALISEKQKKFDPNATADDCIVDLRKVQAQYPLKFITRNFYRHHGQYSDATWGQYFGVFLEFRRQAGLELSRNQHALERHIAKHASLDVYRRFFNEEILPYHEKFDRGDTGENRFKTILTGTDFHDKDCDPFVLSVFIDTAARVQPDVIALGGDVFDLYEFSKYGIDPRQVDIVGRFNFVKTHIFGALRRACPNAQIDLIAGNHEWRLLKHLADRSPFMKVFLSDVMGLSLSQMFGLDEFEINMVAKLDLDAFNKADENETVRENYKVYWESFVVNHFLDLTFGLSGASGHTHRPEQVTFTNQPMGKLSWTQNGCIAETRVEYVDGRDKWTNSFSMAHIDTLTKSVAQEQFLIPKDHCVIHGKRYVRSEG